MKRDKEPGSRPHMNEAEKLVYEVCRRSFLSLWSYMNPRQKPFGRELCDVLVVCDPDVIVFSVKHIKLPNSGKPSVDAERWRRRAVDESTTQVYGAERIIRGSQQVVRHDSSAGVAFPAASDVRIHRIAVALGGGRRVGLPFGDFGKGFVHVLDELSFSILLGELDTVTDFVNYLSKKEQFFKSGGTTVFEGREEDLLALYLHQGRKFPGNCDTMLIREGLWEKLRAKDEYARKQAADQDSYIVDKVIEEFCEGTLGDNLEFSSNPTGSERAIRAIARENRFSRRVLGKSFKEFLDQSSTVRSRKMASPSGVIYVFLATPLSTPRKLRVAELGNRCFVARGLYPDATRVVGLATEQYKKGQGHSLDLYHMYLPQWGSEQQKMMAQLQKEFGYFVSPRVTRDSEDEYPET